MNDFEKMFGNLVRLGTIDVVEGAKARIILLDGESQRKTALLPVLMHASKFKKEYSPLRTGDPVIVVMPAGNADVGFAIRGQFIKDVAVPEEATEDTDVTLYSDGTKVIYDIKESRLWVSLAGDAKVDIAGNVSLNVGGDVTAMVTGSLSVEAATATVKAESVDIDAQSIDLGSGGAGVVTGTCMCAFSGAPHAVVSQKVKAI